MLNLGSVTRALVAPFVALAMIVGLSAFAGPSVAVADRAAPGGKLVAKSSEGKMKSTVVGRTSDGGKLSGTFTPIKAVEKDGVLAMKGFLEGVITEADGKKTRFSGLRTIPVKSINGTAVTDPQAQSRSMNRAAACDILNLVLGPLDLNILGLRVQLSRVELDITAVPGAGNLLGNLLCAVAGLLDGGPLAGLLGQLRNLLNQILGLLNLGL